MRIGNVLDTKKSVKIGALLLAAGLVLSSGVSVKADETGGEQLPKQVTFSDISKHWAKSSIEQAMKKGYVNGYADGTFQPNRQISRAEFTKMLVSALGLTVEPSVDGGKWYDPYFAAASKADITSASEFNNNVDKPLTRLEMSRLAMKALGKKLTGYEPERHEVGHTFDEFKAEGDDHYNPKKFVLYAAQTGVIGGVAPGVIAPDNTTTRAESITVIERILTVKNGGKLKVDKYAVQAAELYWHKTNVFSVMPEFFADGVAHYDPNKLTVESEDKNYKSVIDSVIAIDLADPNDPNLELLPPVKNLRWYARANKPGIPLDKFMNSYLLYIQGRVVKADGGYARFAGSSKIETYIDRPFTANIEDFWNGKLVNIASVFVEGGQIDDRELYLFPKKGLKVDPTKGSLTLYLEVPGIGIIQHDPVLSGWPNF
ncbi:S-layer homology domain-containing protein [Gorillibacterium timonense]|uniref:S-layer homology domain-containing protein n=1 Tax=Gorillibacterium timonense TaxID=1689269 RepID=UPI00071CCD06|nr:S-layer homology domain-containing protein [Gorillibacterium timonense]